MNRLHVTNGDAAIAALRAAGFAEPALAWKDVLHDGPVPGGSDEALREVRARFIAERGWTTLETARTELAARDSMLNAAVGDGETEVLLWFEHDLYDQLQLAQVLDALQRHAARRARVRLVQADDYLGNATPERITRWHGSAHEVTGAELAAGLLAWEALRSPDPRTLDELASTSRTAALPFMRPALRRLVEELPGERDGLARSERQALAALAEGPRTAGEVFQASQQQEEAFYLGDSSFAWYLERLAGCRVPLLRRADAGGAVRAADLTDMGSRTMLALTAEGARVLAGAADHVTLNGVSRWLGGTLLDAMSPWRCRDGRAIRDGSGRTPP